MTDVGRLRNYFVRVSLLWPPDLAPPRVSCSALRESSASTEEKRRTWQETGALAVDLESDVVARIAAASGIPFLVVRTIADSAYRALPPAALIPLAKNGTPKLAHVLASVLRRPRQFGALCGLARETQAALAALVLPARALHGLVGTA